jgi:hypothetical protein
MANALGTRRGKNPVRGRNTAGNDDEGKKPKEFRVQVAGLAQTNSLDSLSDLSELTREIEINRPFESGRLRARRTGYVINRRNRTEDIYLGIADRTRIASMHAY